jgi:hypothetical protein
MKRPGENAARGSTVAIYPCYLPLLSTLAIYPCYGLIGDSGTRLTTTWLIDVLTVSKKEKPLYMALDRTN